MYVYIVYKDVHSTSYNNNDNNNKTALASYSPIKNVCVSSTQNV